MLAAPHLQEPAGPAGVAGPHHAPQPATARLLAGARRRRPGARVLVISPAAAAIAPALPEAAGLGRDCVAAPPALRGPAAGSRSPAWLAGAEPASFDLVALCPPFTSPGDRLGWVTYLRLAWTLVRPGGRLVAVAPAALVFSVERPVAELRGLVDRHGNWAPLPHGTLTDGGVPVPVVLCRLAKPGGCP
jgi:hypothetical protein